jgi:hypothetical protein
MSRAIVVGEPDWKPLEGVLSQQDCADYVVLVVM